MKDKKHIISFVILGSSEDVSGGFFYNKKITKNNALVHFNLIYVKDLEELKSVIRQAHEFLLIDAWALHELAPEHMTGDFHLLAHHPIDLDDTVNKKSENELIFWRKAKSIITTGDLVTSFISERCDTPIVTIIPGLDKLERSNSYLSSPKRIISLSSVIERKGDLLLLEAMQELNHFVLDRYGPSPDSTFLESVKNKANKLTNNQFVYHGQISEHDKVAVITNADLAVFPTYYESYGMAIQECLDAKIPVLVSDFKGAKERFGSLGVRYIDQNKESWRNALNRFIFDEQAYDKIVREIKERTSIFPTWENQSEKLTNHLVKHL